MPSTDPAPAGDPEPGDLVAAIDLGSNSFHFILARWDGVGLHVVDKRKEMVRLAAGLDHDRRLSEAATDLALDCLRRFGEPLRGIDPARVRAVGTNTLRAARDADEFLARACEALGHEIDVISGAEEARLVYMGVSHSEQPAAGRQLVIDIGGGSTECVIGEGQQPGPCHSLRMGCVTYAQGFFSGGKITRDRMQAARFASSNEVVSIAGEFERLGWRRAVGASGTIRAIEQVVTRAGWSRTGIDSDSLDRLRARLLELGHVDELSELDGLSARRRPVFASGVAILTAVFERLGIERMTTSDGGVREGMIYDLVGRFQGRDLRDAAVAAMQRRFGVEVEHARRVGARLDALLDQTAADWELDSPRFRQLARWAAAVHEVGLLVAYSGHHKHGAYLIEHTDMPGFSRGEQRTLAALVLCHRRKFRHQAIRDAMRSAGDCGVRLAALLRLAVRLERGRGQAVTPDLSIAVEGDVIRVQLPANAHAEHPLTVEDLEAERERLEHADLELIIDIE